MRWHSGMRLMVDGAAAKSARAMSRPTAAGIARFLFAAAAVEYAAAGSWPTGAGRLAPS
jgi:hypothetical protein